MAANWVRDPVGDERAAALLAPNDIATLQLGECRSDRESADAEISCQLCFGGEPEPGRLAGDLLSQVIGHRQVDGLG